MSFLSRLADRLILQPTTDYVDPRRLERRVISAPTGNVEVWTASSVAELPDAKQVVLLKFPGTGGRAERSGLFPSEAWPDVACESWTLNHRGYGGSDGPATIQNFAETCDAVMRVLLNEFPDTPIVAYGNSLGCISALYVTARFPVAAAYLRNPPPLARMIATRPRYAAWNFGLSKLIADQVPEVLSSIENAKHSTCPALFIQSELDRVVPTRYQDEICEDYAGTSRKIVLRGADHHHRAAESQLDEFTDAIRWLGEQATRNR